MLASAGLLRMLLKELNSATDAEMLDLLTTLLTPYNTHTIIIIVITNYYLFINLCYFYNL